MWSVEKKQMTLEVLFDIKEYGKLRRVIEEERGNLENID